MRASMASASSSCATDPSAWTTRSSRCTAMPPREPHRSGAGEPAPSRETHRSGAGQPAPSREAHRSGAGQPAPSRETTIVHRGHGLPYSKGLMAQALSATALSEERSFELARLIERRLAERGEPEIDVAALHALA